MSDTDNEVRIGDLERGPSAKFPDIGDSYTGIVLWSKRSPQTDFDTGEILHWNDGSERMQTLVGLDLGGGVTTTLYARGGTYSLEGATGTGEAMEPAIVRVVKQAGDDRIRKGAHLTVTHTGVAKPGKKGMNGAKLFTATYEPPATEASISGLFTDDEADD